MRRLEAYELPFETHFVLLRANDSKKCRVQKSETIVKCFAVVDMVSPKTAEAALKNAAHPAVHTPFGSSFSLLHLTRTGSFLYIDFEFIQNCPYKDF